MVLGLVRKFEHQGVERYLLNIRRGRSSGIIWKPGWEGKRYAYVNKIAAVQYFDTYQEAEDYFITRAAVAGKSLEKLNITHQTLKNGHLKYMKDAHGKQKGDTCE